MTGAFSRAARVRGGPGVMVAVGLLPAGWPLVTDASAVGYVDAVHPLTDLMGDDAVALMAAMPGPDAGEAAYAAALDRWR
jgi:hypothetical protein